MTISYAALSMQGDVGDLTTFTDRKGQLIAFLKAPPRVPASTKQEANRARFTNAQRSWDSLSTLDKVLWNLAADRGNLAITGRNLWIACVMKRNWSYAQTVSRQTGIPLYYGG
jgi:hypothetical protein